MQKPNWRKRGSHYVIDSPFLRLRSDEIELPDGTIVSDYYVRESNGFVVVLALRPDRRVVLVRQYRYGSDEIHLELPAGMLHESEEPLQCAMRELAEETGYEAERWEPAGHYYAEPVRSTARAFIYIARGARPVAAPRLDPTEHLEVELATLDEFRAMLADGRMDTGAGIAAGYVALAHLDGGMKHRPSPRGT